MVISEHIKSLYYNIDEEAYCNGKILYAGEVDGKRYKSLFYIDNSILKELIDNLTDIKLELGIYLKEIVGNNEAIINIEYNKKEFNNYEIDNNKKRLISRFKIKSCCANRYNYIDVTQLIIKENNDKESYKLNLYQENCDGYIKISSYDSGRKPILRVSGRYKKKKIDNCIVENNNNNYDKSFQNGENAKSYGHFVNESGAIECFNEMTYIKWETVFVSQNITLLKDNVTLLVKEKGEYIINYMINISSQNDNVIKLKLNNKVIIGSEIDIKKTHGPISGQILVEIQEVNSQLNLVIEDPRSIIEDQGVVASILMYSL